ncbi:hypothetical protein HNR22_003715 [Micromonospora jinlongensis]|uniref:Uncharacterized protein n=1 Tax=Micromonospora jinlongensis TaxID=1287877 RepID=A0A7Y9X4G7_9ACTN|nr:hypothetical protein [Micromonospora jinlongensis]NYH43988.1 hypothetical protein [Micromonospora jinlongensis]
MALRFEHRDTEIDVSLVDRVWRTRSDAEETMTSAARTCWPLILSRAHRLRGRSSLLEPRVVRLEDLVRQGGGGPDDRSRDDERADRLAEQSNGLLAGLFGIQVSAGLTGVLKHHLCDDTEEALEPVLVLGLGRDAFTSDVRDQRGGRAADFGMVTVLDGQVRVEDVIQGRPGRARMFFADAGQVAEGAQLGARVSMWLSPLV